MKHERYNKVAKFLVRKTLSESSTSIYTPDRDFNVLTWLIKTSLMVHSQNKK